MHPSARFTVGSELLGMILTVIFDLCLCSKVASMKCVGFTGPAVNQDDRLKSSEINEEIGGTTYDERLVRQLVREL